MGNSDGGQDADDVTLVGGAPRSTVPLAISAVTDANGDTADPAGTVPAAAQAIEPIPPGAAQRASPVGSGAATLLGPSPGSASAGGPPNRFMALVNRRRDIAAERQSWVDQARTPIGRPVRIVVASAGGGLGKTTVSLTLAEKLASLRADGVAVLDAQPLGGTVGARVNAQPGWGLHGLIGNLDEVLDDGSYSAWGKWATVEHRTRLTVFGRSQPFDGAELTVTDFARMSAGMSRLWPIVVVDTGAPEGRSALQLAVIEMADVLVVVGAPGQATVAATAGWLRDIDIPPERRVGVVVPLSGGDPDQVHGLLQSVCGQVAHVPVDRALAAEAAVPMLDRARSSTSDAIIRLAGMAMRAATHTPTGQEPR